MNINHLQRFFPKHTRNDDKLGQGFCKCQPQSCSKPSYSHKSQSLTFTDRKTQKRLTPGLYSSFCPPPKSGFLAGAKYTGHQAFVPHRRRDPAPSAWAVPHHPLCAPAAGLPDTSPRANPRNVCFLQPGITPIRGLGPLSGIQRSPPVVASNPGGDNSPQAKPLRTLHIRLPEFQLTLERKAASAPPGQ